MSHIKAHYNHPEDNTYLMAFIPMLSSSTIKIPTQGSSSHQAITMRGFAAAIGTLTTLTTRTSNIIPTPTPINLADTHRCPSSSSCITHIERPPPPAPLENQAPSIHPHAKRDTSSSLPALPSIFNGVYTTTVTVNGQTFTLTRFSSEAPPSLGFTTTSIPGLGVITIPVTLPPSTSMTMSMLTDTDTDTDTALGKESVISETPGADTSDTASRLTLPYTETVLPLPFTSASTGTT
ncbi:hypothetical protein F5Y06DRAFT_182858 [Hypoxylon sp. FL0890]|nr:hypothetical protein F5Y06DRAFT_182858 [Hypoxylon sp. FL0890]